MIVLGIDPGTAATGYGILEYRNSKIRVIGYGVIRTKSKDRLLDRIKVIYDSIVAIINRFKIDYAVVERIFVSKNPQTALTLGHTRGVILLAIANNNVEFIEYAARVVKQSLTGYGGASKKQVNDMIKQLLNIDDDVAEDAADALAIAYVSIMRM